MNLKFSFRAFNRLFGFSVATKPYIDDRQFGFTNRCIDGKYIVCLDYDKVRIDWLVPELKIIQETWDLGTFYIIESSPGKYWAVCLDKMRFRDFVDLIHQTSCDASYRHVPLSYGMRLWTIRLSTKKGFPPKLVGIIKRKPRHRTRQTSLAHAIIMERFYPQVTIDGYTDFRDDGYVKLILSSYGAEKEKGDS